MSKVSENTKRELNDPNPETRQLAVKKLAKTRSAEARRLIVERLQQEDNDEVLEWLLIGIAQTHAFEAKAQVLELLKHRMNDVRRFACEALGNIGDLDCVVPLGLLGSKDKDHQVRLAAIMALKAIGIRPQDASATVSAELHAAIIAELHAVWEIHWKNQGSPASQDLARAANVALLEVRKSVAKVSVPPLIDFEEDLFSEPGKNTKTKELDRLQNFLEAHGADVSEIRYVVRVTRSIIRKSQVVTKLKGLGIESCQLCDQPFFAGKSGKMYCQAAHIKALEAGGRDSIDNVLLLCAGCHAQMDMGKESSLKRTGSKPEILHVSLPNGVEQSFELNKGKPPKRLTRRTGD